MLRRLLNLAVLPESRESVYQGDAVDMEYTSNYTEELAIQFLVYFASMYVFLEETE